MCHTTDDVLAVLLGILVCLAFSALCFITDLTMARALAVVIVPRLAGGFTFLVISLITVGTYRQIQRHY